MAVGLQVGLRHQMWCVGLRCVGQPGANDSSCSSGSARIWAVVASLKGSAAAVDLAEGHGYSFISPAFLPALAKDLPVGDALGEVFNGEASHGADLLQGAIVEPCQYDSGDQREQLCAVCLRAVCLRAGLGWYGSRSVIAHLAHPLRWNLDAPVRQRSGSSSTHCTRQSRNSATGSLAPKFN